MEVLPEVQLAAEPNRIVVLVDDAYGLPTDMLADEAVNLCRRMMPKVTGAMAMNIQPMYGPTHFGIYFPDRRVWFLDQGTRGRTMRNLAGKTVPMWVEDVPDSVKRNPKTKRRTTVDGRVQYRIFRRVAERGQRRNVVHPRTGEVRSVPMSYPGAPGRIARRQPGRPFTGSGRVAGQIARGNVGVRWYNPGITGRRFLNSAMTAVSRAYGIDPRSVYLADDPTFYTLTKA